MRTAKTLSISISAELYDRLVRLTKKRNKSSNVIDTPTALARKLLCTTIEKAADLSENKNTSQCISCVPLWRAKFPAAEEDCRKFHCGCTCHLIGEELR